MKVSVFGLGYVGCVTASCLARDGHQVIGVDVNPDKVAMINEGASPIVEPGLSELVTRVVREGRLVATASAEEAIRGTDIALICVGTPDLGHGQPDLDALARVASAIGSASQGRSDPLLVVLRSTVLPGTTEKVFARILAERTEAQRGSALIRMAVNPEFMREGSSLRDFDRPPFILVGCDDSMSADALRSLYAGVDAQFVQTTVRTAEMVKYVCNSFHALKVCFTNEVADLCDALGADAQEVMQTFRLDHKLNISDAYLKPGFAFGGSCLPKDVRALLSAGRINALSLPLLDAIMPSNEGQVRRGIEAVLRTRRRRIGVVGLAFKPTTDDLRESPMVTLVETLIGKGCDVRVFDPNVVLARLKGANRRYIETEIPHIASLLCDDIEAFIAHAEVLVFGAASHEAAQVLASARPEQTIIDLSRGGAGVPQPREKESPVCALS